MSTDPSTFEFRRRDCYEAKKCKIVLPKHMTVPSWIKGINVSNSPMNDNSISMVIVVESGFNPLSWAGKVFHFHKQPKRGDSYYLAESDDGRGDCHHAEEAVWSDKFQAYVTPQDKGYGGRHFPGMLATPKGPQPMIFRGPWHSVPPTGWIDVTFYEQGRGQFFGLCIKSEYYYAAVKKYQPDYEAYEFTKLYAQTDFLGKTTASKSIVEWAHKDDIAPKVATQERLQYLRERMAEQRK